MSSKSLPDRIGKLIDALSQGLFERKDIMRLCLLAALCGESVFMLGPPGIAKSLLARRLIHAFDQSKAFEYLMTRFSTPEEVFGPLSIQALKDEGRYLRLIEGYLPDAEVVFLDEIWKAGPAILNTLLTVINEHKFRNGEKEIAVPMRLLVTASNELPQEESGLEALYDRMLLRLWVDRIQNKQNFRAMLTSRQDPAQDTVPVELKIGDDEYKQWQQQLTQVGLSDALFEQFYQLRERLNALASEGDEEHKHSLYVSDRRWKKALRLLQASAFFNGRNQIGPLDLLLLKDCLWHDLYAREQITRELTDFARLRAFEQERLHFAMQRIQQDLHHYQEDQASELGCLMTAVGNSLLRRSGWELDFKANHLDLREPSYPILLLQAAQLDPKQPERAIRSIDLARTELLRWLRKGEPVLCRLNNDTHTSPLTLDVDQQKHLVVRDLANRTVQLVFMRHQGMPTWQRQRWQEKLQELDQQRQTLRKEIQQQRHRFTDACPHLFLPQEWLLLIEDSLLQLSQKEEALDLMLQEARDNLELLLQHTGGKE